MQNYKKEKRKYKKIMHFLDFLGFFSDFLPIHCSQKKLLPGLGLNEPFSQYFTDICYDYESIRIEAQGQFF